MRKAQVSIFIIIGIILLIIVGSYFALQSSKEIIKEPIIEEVPVELQPVKNYVDNCLDKTSREGLRLIGEQGGYYDIPDEYSSLFFLDLLTYYYIDDEIIMPDLEFIQSEISKYVYDNINQCLDGFKSFKEQGMDFELGDKRVDTFIAGKNIIINLDYPITIKQKDYDSKIQKFGIKIDSNLKEILSLSEAIVSYYSKNPGYICLSCMQDLRIDEEMFDVNLVPLFDEIVEEENRNDVLLVEIVDKEPVPENYTFRFIMDYNIKKEDVSFVDIEDIDRLSAKIGYEFIYEVKASGEDINFSDNSDLFNISPVGVIRFTPDINQIGKYITEITATDKYGNSDSDIFLLEIGGFVNPPRIDYIGYHNAKVGEKFFYQINAKDQDGDRIWYITDNNLFNISKTDGIIDFIPKLKDVGDHIIIITAIDETGGKDTQEMNLRIVE